MSNSKIGYIDALKGIAAIAIVIAHSGANLISGSIGRISSLGPTAVGVFLMISGMLTMSSLHTHFDGSGMTFKSLIKWYFSKFLRLAPLFYIAVFTGILTHTWSEYWLGEEGVITIPNVISHLLLLHGLFPYYANSILGLEWYVGVLFIFILISPIIYRFVNTLRKSVVLLVVLLLIKPFVTPYLYNIYEFWRDYVVYRGYIDSVGPYANITIFMMGVVIYHIFNLIKDKKPDEKRGRLLSYGLLVLSLLLIIIQYRFPFISLVMSMNESYALIYSLIIISQFIWSTKLIDNAFFRLLGKYSYGIYLFQIIVFSLYDRFINYTGRASWSVKFVSCFVVIFIVSFVLTNLIDFVSGKKRIVTPS